MNFLTRGKLYLRQVKAPLFPLLQVHVVLVFYEVFPFPFQLNEVHHSNWLGQPHVRLIDYLKSADLIYIVEDITQGKQPYEPIDNTLLKRNVVSRIYNKIDLISKSKLVKIRGKSTPELFASALTGLGINKLKKHILTSLNLESNPGENIGLTTPRQYNSIIKSGAAITAVMDIADKKPIQLELVSFELQNALLGIEGLLGTKTADEILDNMFKAFCVGK